MKNLASTAMTPILAPYRDSILALSNRGRGFCGITVLFPFPFISRQVSGQNTKQGYKFILWGILCELFRFK